MVSLATIHQHDTYRLSTYREIFKSIRHQEAILTYLLYTPNPAACEKIRMQKTLLYEVYGKLLWGKGSSASTPFVSIGVVNDLQVIQLVSKSIFSQHSHDFRMTVALLTLSERRVTGQQESQCIVP